MMILIAVMLYIVVWILTGMVITKILDELEQRTVLLLGLIWPISLPVLCIEIILEKIMKK